MGHQVAIAAIEAGDVERGHALLADAVSASIDVELLNDLGVLGRLGEAEAILTTAAMLDAERADVTENLVALAELRDGKAWRACPGRTPASSREALTCLSTR